MTHPKVGKTREFFLLVSLQKLKKQGRMTAASEPIVLKAAFRTVQKMEHRPGTGNTMPRRVLETITAVLSKKIVEKLSCRLPQRFGGAFEMERKMSENFLFGETYKRPEFRIER
jgi:hypothetical protein